MRFDRPFVAVAVALAFVAFGALAQTTAPDPSVARGKRLFLQCASCHEVGDSAVVKTGPTLKDIRGRAVASVPGYAYSPALKALSFTWDDGNLDRWLQQPTQVAPGTAMAFIGIANADDRKALIAYLSTLK